MIPALQDQPESTKENDPPNLPQPITKVEEVPDEPTDTLTVGAKACYVNQTPIGDQHAMKAMWEAMTDSTIKARWVKVECQPQILNPGI